MGDLDHRSLKTALSDDNSMVLGEDSITLWWWEGGGTAAGQNHLLLLTAAVLVLECTTMCHSFVVLAKMK